LNKPIGWKGKKTDQWWTNDSAFGVRYMCSDCGRKTLGIVWGEASRQMHYKDCPRINKIKEESNAE
jgi:hypothetical protein